MTLPADNTPLPNDDDAVFTVERGGNPEDWPVVIRAGALTDKRLSYEAIGMLAHLFAQPDGYNTDDNDDFDDDAPAMQELKRHGYITPHDTIEGDWYITDAPATTPTN